ncbi:unnamed protein product [Mesocestoides corti]|uniref:Uncharacterized protein n=1 Tax=Mesocestoides corti TaxID=53468 RepID=A0A0R3UN55_MESCO|nr:unnamed protein product [Mesocestoides corti]
MPLNKKKLYMKLQCLESFSNPKQHLEQYPTSSQVAGSDILFDMQTRHDALNKKTVADLGSSVSLLVLISTETPSPQLPWTYATWFSNSVIGIDVEFLKVALGLSRNHVYSLHKTTTRKHIMKTIQELGAMCEVVAELRFDIPRMYKKHRQLSKDIAVDFFHSWFERSNT